jgi:hypothetical protein
MSTGSYKKDKRLDSLSTLFIISIPLLLSPFLSFLTQKKDGKEMRTEQQANIPCLYPTQINIKPIRTMKLMDER